MDAGDIITLLIIAFGAIIPSVKSAIRKSRSVVVSDADGSTQEYGIPEDDDTDLFDEMDDEFDMDSEYYEQAEEWSDDAQQTDEEEERDFLGRAIFTYESDDTKVNEVAANQPPLTQESAPRSVAADDDSDEPKVMGEPFDLRKALIYQTILKRVS